MEGNTEFLPFIFAGHYSSVLGQGGRCLSSTSMTWFCHGSTFCYFINFNHTICYVEKNISP